MTEASRGRGWRELALVALGHAALTAVLTSPLSTHIGSVARLDNADTRLLIWNVAWVARTLVVDPLHVFDANIFYPHRGTLAYSESNLGAGILAIPVYWATRNPYAAHNVAVLLSFVLTGTCTYYLVRYLTANRRAAAISSVCFAYTPYAFSHLPHVHLLMTAGLPLSLLAFHRLADRPTLARGAALGGAMGAQALFSGYYAVFVTLVVGFAVLTGAAIRRRWTDAKDWTAIAAAAVVSMAIAIPLFLPYLRLQEATGFSRTVEESRLWSAGWRSYLASSAYAHSWLLPLIGRWVEVLFPGFVALIAGIAGIWMGWRAGGRSREIVILYGGIALLAFWASLGPGAGLYALLYKTIPAFSFLHAPSRFGLLVVFALSVLAGISLSALLARRTWIAAALVCALAVAEMKTPLSFSPVPPVEPAYKLLATLPPGPVIELPFYSWRFAAARTWYMLNSTIHWNPLVNGYSSHTPREFLEKTPILGGFPSEESFRLLERDRVRYAVFHLHQFDAATRQDVIARIQRFDGYLVRHYADDRIWLYEIVKYPSDR